MADRRSAHLIRSRARSERGESHKSTPPIERFLKVCAALQDTCSLEKQIAYVLDAARESVGVDRLAIWGLGPESNRLIHVASSGLSKPDRDSLSSGTEIPLSAAGAMGIACRDNTAVIVDQSHRLPSKARLKLPYSEVKALRTSSFVVVPIVARGHVLGVLVADNKYRRAPLPE